MTTPAPVDTEPYDEFAFLRDVAVEVGGDPDAVLPCARVDVEVAPGKHISALSGARPRPSSCSCTAAGRTPTRGTRCMTLLGRPAIAVDLPGHGRSTGATTATMARGPTPK